MGAVIFSEVLMHMRLRAGFSQNKLADRAGCNHSTISRFEGGSRSPARDTVEALAVALDVDADDRADLLASAGFTGGEAPLTPELRELAEVLADRRLGPVTTGRITKVLRLAVDYGRMQCR